MKTGNHLALTKYPGATFKNQISLIPIRTGGMTILIYLRRLCTDVF